MESILALLTGFGWTLWQFAMQHENPNVIPNREQVALAVGCCEIEREFSLNVLGSC